MRPASLPFFALFLCGLVTACAPRSTVLAIAVSSIPKTTSTIDIKLTIDGQIHPADPPFTYDRARGASTVLTGIEIPWQFSDRLLGVDIEARDDKCPLARFSSATAAIEPGTYTVSAPLQALANDDLITDLFAADAITPDDVWIGGANQGLAHWDGCYWTRGQLDMQLGAGALVRVYHHPRVGLWAVGSEGLILHFDAAQKLWRVISAAANLYTGRTANFSDITFLPGSAGSEGSMLVVGSLTGSSPVCFALRGTMTAPDTFTWAHEPAVCNALSPATTLGCNNCRFYPTRMQAFDSGGLVIGGASGSLDGSMNMIYQGAFVRFADSTLQNPDGRLLTPVMDLPNQAVMPWGMDLGDLYLGGGRLTRVTGEGGATQITQMMNFYNDPSNSYAISGMWGTTTSDFWIVGVHTQTRFSRLHHITDPSNPNSNIYSAIGSYQINSLHGTSPDDIWFVGNGGLRSHYDGKIFSIIRDR
jgi:hypothetical protein